MRRFDNNQLPTGSYSISGSFSGSFQGAFVGDGTGIQGITATAEPAGPVTSVQFNDGLNVSGSSDFTFDKTTGQLIVTSASIADIYYPTTDGIDRQVIKTDGAGNLEFGYPDSTTIRVINSDTITLQKGIPVHATSSGTLGNVTGVILADASDLDKTPATAILNQTLNPGEEGEAILSGYISGVSTIGFTSGEVIYLAPGGGYTQTKPTGSNYIQNLGIVTKIDPTNGAGIVFGAGRVNDLPNILSGYAWVGNTIGVPIAVSTSSLFVDSASFAHTSSYITTLNQDVIISGSINITGSLVASGLNYPTADQEQGDVLTTDGTGNLTFEKPTVYAAVKNISGGTLPKGTPVHVTSSVGNVDEVVAALASNPLTMPATFVLAQQLDNEEEGLGIAIGFINGVNTSGFSEGEIVYVGANGGYTNIKPTGSNAIQNLGIVTKIDATNGSGYVYGSGRANDVPNINPGYIWLGNSDWVATPTPTSSIQNVVSSSYALTASYAINGGSVGSTDTGSLLTTASVSLNTITFTKGDGSTFPITVDTGSGGGATDTGSLLVTASISENIFTFTKGDSSTFDLTFNTGSFVLNSQTSSMSVATASYVDYNNIDNKPTLVSGSSQVSFNGITDVPAGILSSSAQIATDISGAFSSDSASFASLIETNTTNINTLTSATSSYIVNSQTSSMSVATASYSAQSQTSIEQYSYNAGILTGSAGWSQSFNGTITLPTVQAALYDNAYNSGSIAIYTVTGGTTGTDFTALTDNSTNYICISYNGGSPEWQIHLSGTNFNGSDIIHVYTVYRLGNFIHILDFGDHGRGLSNKLNLRLIGTQRFARESGFALGLSGSNGAVTLSEGVAWNSVNKQQLAEVNSELDFFFKNYHVSGAWTVDTSQDYVNNAYYDDGTDLVAVGSGKYLVNYYYRGQEINDHIYEVISQAQYDNVADAQLDTAPNLPELVSSHTFLAGRIIIQSGSTTGVVESAFTTQFQATQVTSHNDLGGIQGGAAGDYLHLTTAEYQAIAYTNQNNDFTGYNTVSGSFTGSLLGTSSWAENSITSSYIDFSNIDNTPTLVSGSSQISYNGITDIPVGILSSSTQIASDISGAFTADSASFSNRITTNETDITTLTSATSSYVLTSQTSSMSVLTSETASYVAGANVDGNITGNANNITAYTINQNLSTTDQVTFGGITSSLYGTSSWAENSITASYLLGSIESASYAVTSSYALTAQTLLGSVVSAETASYILGSGVDGDITGNAANITAYTINQNLSTTDQVTFSGITASLSGNATSATSATTASYVTGTAFTIDPNNAITDNSVPAIDIGNRILLDSTNSDVIDWESKWILDSDSNIVLQWDTPGSATFNGTSSFATTASYALSSGGATAFPYSGSAVITGSLTIYNSGSVNPLIKIQGGAGELFSVYDTFSGSLFSVNNQTGNPILEVTSDNTITFGKPGYQALLTTQETFITASGAFTVYSIPTASYDGAWFEYVIRNGSNAKVGQIMAVWDGANVNFSDMTTTAFGSVSDISLGVFIVGGNFALTGSAASTGWTMKTIIRSI